MDTFDKYYLNSVSDVVQQALTANMDEHSRAPICIYTISRYTGLLPEQVVDALEFLSEIKALVILDAGEGFNIHSELYDPTRIYHCLLRSKISPHSFTPQQQAEQKSWQE